MAMAFKRQLVLCPRPRDLLLVSYNHLDSVRKMVEDTPNVLNQVDETQRRVIEVRYDGGNHDDDVPRNARLNALRLLGYAHTLSVNSATGVT